MRDCRWWGRYSNPMRTLTSLRYSPSVVHSSRCHCTTVDHEASPHTTTVNTPVAQPFSQSYSLHSDKKLTNWLLRPPFCTYANTSALKALSVCNQLTIASMFGITGKGIQSTDSFRFPRSIRLLKQMTHANSVEFNRVMRISLVAHETHTPSMGITSHLAARENSRLRGVEFYSSFRSDIRRVGLYRANGDTFG